jgi:hypothetical protein
MAHIPPGAALRWPLPSGLTLHPPHSLTGSRTSLHEALIAKRASVAILEAEWVAAAETEVARPASRAVHVDDRATWDKSAWQRYLTAAAAHEADYKPRIMRLLRDIDSLEMLLALPASAKAA